MASKSEVIPIAQGNMVTRKRHVQDKSEIIAAKDIVRGRIRDEPQRIIADQHDETDSDADSSEGAGFEISTQNERVMTISRSVSKSGVQSSRQERKDTIPERCHEKTRQNGQ